MAHEHALDIVNVISDNMRQNMMQACASSARGSNDPWYPIASGPASPPTTITRYVVRDPEQIPFKACPSPPAEARAKKGATYNRAAPYISQTGKAKAAAAAATHADWVAAQAAADTAADAAHAAAAAAAAVIPVPPVRPAPVLPPPTPVPLVRRPAPIAPTPAPTARRGSSSGGR